MSRMSLDVPVQRRAIPDKAVVLDLPIMPPSVNAMYFNVPGTGRVKTQKYRDWLHASGLILKRQVTGCMGGRVDLRFQFEDCHPRADCSNFIKAAEDLLVSIGIIPNDNAKHVRSVKAEWAPIKGVRIEIERCAA